MADTKISALPAATVPLAGTEVLPIVQSSTTKQVSVANLTAGRAISASSITNSALTSGRVTYAGASGLLSDSANLTFDGTTLTATTGANFCTTSGSVGIGTSSLTAKLEVKFDTTVSASNGAIGIENAGSGEQGITFTKKGYSFNGPAAAITYNGSALGVSSAGYLAFRTNGGVDTFPTERMRIASDGIVTMSAYGAGAATFSASGVISSVSDETWKTKDGVPTNPDVMLQKLEPGYWFYNEEKAPTFGEERQLGFYAQNVNAAIGPEAAPTPETYTELDKNGVEVTKTKPWGYYDRSVLAVAVMSLKNALNTIEELKQRITALENK